MMLRAREDTMQLKEEVRQFLSDPAFFSRAQADDLLLHLILHRDPFY